MHTLFGEDNHIPQNEFVTDYPLILQKLQRIQPVKYAKTRNFINGAVTYLSPYISRGVISIKQVQQAVLSNGYKPYEIEKFLQELAWREYYQRVWQAKGDAIFSDIKQQQPDVAHHQMVNAVLNASTGITAIDAQIEHLYSTGYMHNHIRMYVASIACNIAKAHWLQPAKWMYYHLLDGDLASNNCSWQWVAAAFASKKYYCNQENINKYTYSNQQHTFLDEPYHVLPVMPVPAALQATGTLQLQTPLPATPLPVIDTSKPTLLYNAYNIDPLWRSNEDANRVLLLEPSHYQQYPVSKNVITFIINLAKNIPGIQVYCGGVTALQALYNAAAPAAADVFYSKKHPLYQHYPGIKDSRDWLYPQVMGYYPSFFAYWKQCERYLKKG